MPYPHVIFSSLTYSAIYILNGCNSLIFIYCLRYYRTSIFHEKPPVIQAGFRTKQTALQVHRSVRVRNSRLHKERRSYKSQK